MFSIIMPTYNQATYIRRAILSLFSQIYKGWELIIINDGCTDSTDEFLIDLLSDERILYIKNKENKGLGYSLNIGLSYAKYEYIAYLPSDDYYYENHLKILKEEFNKSENIVLVYSSINSDIKDSLITYKRKKTNGIINNCPLQLVQVAHRRTNKKWIEREEYITDNLYHMFWQKIAEEGYFSFTNEETCYWTNHRYQRHKLINERYGGGLNIYRQYYSVKGGLKLKVSSHKIIDEKQQYKYTFNKSTTTKNKKLKILLVGELAYNPDRIIAFEEYGHKMYGLWMRKPSFSFSTVGPLPFGKIEDIPYDSWEEKIKQIKPDIIYGLLNFGAIEIAHMVVNKYPNIPFVWHFKEGPFVCREHGLWEKLIHLYNKADGKIFINEETKIWYEQFIPKSDLSYILDGDLPKNEYFKNKFSSLLSLKTNEIHTVIPGRVIGINFNDIQKLVEHKIHIHVYNENYYNPEDQTNSEILKSFPNYFHIHPNCPPDKWVEEFSQYDAGWLHYFQSENNGKIMNAGWDDLNMPARINTLAAAGLPMIQKDNSGHIVASLNLTKKLDIGLFFKNIDDLAVKLKNKNRMNHLRNNVKQKRCFFTFDYYIADLLNFFNLVIEHKKKPNV